MVIFLGDRLLAVVDHVTRDGLPDDEREEKHHRKHDIRIVIRHPGRDVTYSEREGDHRPDDTGSKPYAEFLSERHIPPALLVDPACELPNRLLARRLILRAVPKLGRISGILVFHESAEVVEVVFHGYSIPLSLVVVNTHTPGSRRTLYVLYR